MLNRPELQAVDCYFAGGTAIVLALGEYRESNNIEFMVASAEGYRHLRNLVTANNLGDLLPKETQYARDVFTDQYSVRTFVKIDDVPIKIEFVRESRIPLSGHFDPVTGVPTLNRIEQYAEKLLANADRGLDASTNNRDLIDLGMMLYFWGPVPDQAYALARNAYGEHLDKSLEQAKLLLAQPGRLKSCLVKLGMSDDFLCPLKRALELPLEPECSASLDDDYNK